MANNQMAWQDTLGEEVSQLTYYTLLNDLLPEYQLPWVDPIFVPGHPCFEAYRDMHEAYARLRGRLGVVDEDPDAEEMIDKLLEHGKLLAFEMFRYGMFYQKRLDEEQPGA